MLKATKSLSTEFKIRTSKQIFSDLGYLRPALITQRLFGRLSYLFILPSIVQLTSPIEAGFYPPRIRYKAVLVYCACFTILQRRLSVFSGFNPLCQSGLSLSLPQVRRFVTNFS